MVWAGEDELALQEMSGEAAARSAGWGRGGLGLRVSIGFYRV